MGNIAFIKCDIESGEEEILMDILTKSFEQKIYVYMSFHISWWGNDDINRFRTIFLKFTIKEFEHTGGMNLKDPINFLMKFEHASILFCPS